MTAMTGSTLTVESLKQLAASPDATRERIGDVLLALASSDEEVRAWASDCLSQLDSIDHEASNEVAKHCEHPSPVVVSWACKLLAKCSPADPAWESLICQVLGGHDSVAVRAEAAGALGRLESLTPQTKQALAEAAESDDPRLSRLAGRALDQ